MVTARPVEFSAQATPSPPASDKANDNKKLA
jgi:hypothetical protein